MVCMFFMRNLWFSKDWMGFPKTKLQARMLLLQNTTGQDRTVATLAIRRRNGFSVYIVVLETLAREDYLS